MVHFISLGVPDVHVISLGVPAVHGIFVQVFSEVPKVGSTREVELVTSAYNFAPL